MYTIFKTVLYGRIQKEFIKWADKNGFGKQTKAVCEGFYAEIVGKTAKVKGEITVGVF